MESDDHSPNEVARPNLYTCFFFAFSLFFGGIYLFSRPALHSTVLLCASILLGWLGLIQLLNDIARHFPPFLARCVHWVHAMTFESFAVFGILLSHATRLFSSTNRRSSETCHGRPILLVHGYFNDSTVWIYQKKQLEESGIGPIYTIDLGYPFRSIIDYAAQVNEKAKLIAKETGREDLSLIGYSMGGLVSVWYATHVAPKGKVTDIITIGSPFGGTPAARIGIGPNAREMERNSLFLKRIQKEVAENEQIRFYHIASKSDEIVYPGASTAIIGNDPNRHFVIEDVGHAGLIYSRRVSEQIRRWLVSK